MPLERMWSGTMSLQSVKGSPQIPHVMSCSTILRVSNFFISAADLISRITPRMVRVFDALNASEVSEPHLFNTLASATHDRLVNRAAILCAEVHRGVTSKLGYGRIQPRD